MNIDPITNGHLDIIRRASRLYDKVVVGVLTNTSKQPMFEKSQRADFIKRSTAELGNVEVAFFEGLLVDFLRKENAKVIIKGLRATSDFEYEFQMALVNKQLCPEVETVFLSSNEKFTYLSSSVVREIGRLGGDVSMFVPPEILGDVNRAMHGE